MKKILISLLVALVLLVAGSGVNAEGRGGGQDKKANEALDKAKAEAPAAKEKAAEKANEALEKAKAEAAAAKAKAVEKAKEARAKADKAKEEAGKAEAEKARAEKVTDAAQDKAKGKAAEKSKAKVDEKALGKEHQQQLAALRKQLTHEGQKHLERKARLERIRQLAADAGKTETVARVDKLVAKEQQRYDGKLKTMTAREQKILQGGDLEDAAAKGKAKADKLKDKAEKAAEEAEKAKGEAKKAGGE